MVSSPENTDLIRKDSVTSVQIAKAYGVGCEDYTDFDQGESFWSEKSVHRTIMDNLKVNSRKCYLLWSFSFLDEVAQ